MCLLRFVRSIFCIWAACCDCFGIGSHSASGKRRTDTFNLNTHSFVSRKYFSVSISFRLAFMVYYDSIHIHFIILLLLRSTLLAFAHCWSCFDRKKIICLQYTLRPYPHYVSEKRVLHTLRAQSEHLYYTYVLFFLFCRVVLIATTFGQPHSFHDWNWFVFIRTFHHLSFHRILFEFYE